MSISKTLISISIALVIVCSTLRNSTLRNSKLGEVLIAITGG